MTGGAGALEDGGGLGSRVKRSCGPDDGSGRFYGMFNLDLWEEA